MLKYLKTIHSLPYPTLDGRIVDTPGYDPETCIFLDLPGDYMPRVPMKPTREQVKAALVTMMAPWSMYRFAGPNDEAAMLAAAFTVLARPVLPICPAIMVDAALPGSGKSQAAGALVSLITGELPAVTPMPANRGEDEEKKLIVSMVRARERVLFMDNIKGVYKSSVIEAMLTSGCILDRVLGKSELVKVETSMFVAMTSNNADLGQDLQRRTMTVRVNGGERPTEASFPFSPAPMALAQRLPIAEAACLVWRAYFAEGCPGVKQGDAGFPDWNRMVRQLLLWLLAEGLAADLPWQMKGGDPAAPLVVRVEDPEALALGDMLRAAFEMSDGAPFSTGEAWRWFTQGATLTAGNEGEFRSAALELCGRPLGSARSLTPLLKHRRDRPAAGLKLVMGQQDAAGQWWRVIRAAA